MAKNKQDSTKHTATENVGEALTKFEQFFEDNKKPISIVMISIAVIVGAYFLAKKYYIEPIEKEAQEQMFVAEQYFEKDSFNLALNGDGNNWGFLRIIDEYSISKSGNLAHYYAGICYLHLGNYQEAIDHLKKFHSNDYFVGPIALGATGDAYIELGNKEKALKYYLKAAKKSNNDFTTPIYLMKAAGVCESINDFKTALKYYNIIKKEHPRSSEARMIDKYIMRAEAMSK